MGLDEETSNPIDLRDVEDEFYHPYRMYSIEDMELFMKPTTFHHFKKRIDLLVEKEKDNTLLFLRNGYSNICEAIKYEVLNHIPTRDKELTHKIYVYLYDILGLERLRQLIKDYAEYMERFK